MKTIITKPFHSNTTIFVDLVFALVVVKPRSINSPCAYVTWTCPTSSALGRAQAGRHGTEMATRRHDASKKGEGMLWRNCLDASRPRVASLQVLLASTKPHSAVESTIRSPSMPRCLPTFAFVQATSLQLHCG